MLNLKTAFIAAVLALTAAGCSSMLPQLNASGAGNANATDASPSASMSDSSGKSTTSEEAAAK